jgi:hypothetical protein
MNYELAKKLKDAGYPFKAMDIDVALDESHPVDCPCLPTLSELIESCGELFGTLIMGKIGMWSAYPADLIITDTSVRGFGSTPEESVAALWLKLNKK